MYQKQVDGNGECIVILRLEDGASISLDPENSDYADYLAWVEAGNQPMPDPSQSEEAIQARVVAVALAERGRRIEEADTATLGMADAFLAGLLTEEDQARYRAYAAYKLALAKVSEKAGWPHHPAWPEDPSV